MCIDVTRCRREAHFAVLAENCDEPLYVKLIEALCKEHNIPLMKVRRAVTRALPFRWLTRRSLASGSVSASTTRKARLARSSAARARWCVTTASRSRPRSSSRSTSDRASDRQQSASGITTPCFLLLCRLFFLPDFVWSSK